MAVDELIKLLSTAYNKSPNSNNYKLLKVLDSEYSNIEQTISDVKYSHFVDYATGKSLDQIASLFNVRRKQNETDEHFRARIKLMASILKGTGTIDDLREIIATALITQTSRVRVRDRYDLEPAFFEVWVWLQDLNNAGLTLDEFRELLNAVKPAGTRFQAYQQGTFTYRSVNGISDPTKGYNDLANSNPDAGTYAGLLPL